MAVTINCGAVDERSRSMAAEVTVTSPSPGGSVNIAWATTPGGPYLSATPAEDFNGDDPFVTTLTAMNIQPGTQYYMIARHFDDTGSNVEISTECAFQTDAAVTFCDPATDIEQTSATISGRGTAQTGETLILEYRNSGDSGFTQAATLPGNGSEQTITADLTGLNPSTTYRFRTRVVRADGEDQDDSNDCLFTTEAIPATQQPIIADCEPACSTNAAQTLPVRSAPQGVGSDGPASNVTVQSSCEDPVHVEVCNPAVQPVAVVTDQEQLGCTVDGNGNVTGRVFLKEDDQTPGTYYMIHVDTSGTVTDPYTGSWVECPNMLPDDAYYQVTTSLVPGCANGVAWNRWVVGVNDTRTGQPVAGIPLIVEYYNDDFGTTTTQPEGWQIGACSEQRRRYTATTEALDWQGPNGEVGLRQLTAVLPDNSGLHSVTVRSRGGDVYVSGSTTIDDSGRHNPVRLEPGEVVSFDAGDDANGWIGAAIVIDVRPEGPQGGPAGSQGGRALVTYQYRRAGTQVRNPPA